MIYIVDMIGTVVQSMRNGGGYDPYYEAEYEQGIYGPPYYMYGHRQEIANRLSLKDKNVNQKKKKYPLIALKLDIIENVRGNVVDFTLNLVIATYSDSNQTADQRYVNTFKPILYPLYDQFMTQLVNSGLFTWDSSLDMLVPPHQKADRPFWGTPDQDGSSRKNIFNDPIDAIEIINLKLSVVNTNC